MKITNFLKQATVLIACQIACIDAFAQCSICTKTASQIGEEAGRGFNAGILYLAAMPFGIVGYITYKWWKSEHTKDAA